MSDEIPRRARIDLNTESELNIRDVIELIERMGPDVRLNRAVVWLNRARENVADFIDGIDPRDPQGDLEQAVDDLTLANAALKRHAEVDHVAIARLTFRNKELEDTNADLLGEKGIETAKQLVSMLHEYKMRNTVLTEALQSVAMNVPGEFWPEGD